MASTILLFDDVTVSLLPAGYDAYAAYADGAFKNAAQVQARFPKAAVLSIDVNGTDTSADALDIENGDATNATAVSWVRAKTAAKAKLVVVYTSVSNVNDLVAVLTNAGITRTEYKIWSAHYGAGTHICGPATCNLTSYACDGTQFTQTAFGDSLDESVCDSGFLGTVQAPVTTDPTLAPGDTGDYVRTLQTRLNVWGYKLAVDGDFGPEVETAVKDLQTKHKLTVDGVAGPATWALLNSAPPAPAPAPAAPLAAPAGLGEDFTRYPLVWDEVKGATSYNVKVTDTATGALLVNSTVTGTSVVLSKLVNARHYNVFVSALGGPTPFGYAATRQIIA